MNITKEQYTRASERRSDRMKRLKAGSKRCMTVIYILLSISAVFLIIYILFKKIISLVLFLVLLAGTAVMYVLTKKSVSEFTVKECHTPVSSGLSELERLMGSESYSDAFISKANGFKNGMDIPFILSQKIMSYIYTPSFMK